MTLKTLNNADLNYVSFTVAISTVIADRAETVHAYAKIATLSPPSSLQQIPKFATLDILFLGV